MTDNGFWRSKETVERYQHSADIIIPDRRKILSKITALVMTAASARLRVLDIGCGYGDLTAEILKACPDASINLLDVSGEMIRIVQERFSDNPDITADICDLNAGIPGNLRSMTFDAVVSTFALHHVDLEKRVVLYSQIRETLSGGGLFINGDMFIGESPFITDWELDNMCTRASEGFNREQGLQTTPGSVKHVLRKESVEQGDKPGTIWDTYADLRQAGFSFVDCVWMDCHFGIIVASKKRQET